MENDISTVRTYSAFCFKERFELKLEGKVKYKIKNSNNILLGTLRLLNTVIYIRKLENTMKNDNIVTNRLPLRCASEKHNYWNIDSY